MRSTPWPPPGGNRWGEGSDVWLERAAGFGTEEKSSGRL